VQKEFIKKAVIPAAGFGTRMLPAAKAVPKELLPVIDRPAIQHIVQEAAAAGVDDLLLISSREKPTIEAHFQPNASLDARLAAGGKQAMLAELNDLLSRVRINVVHQDQQLGLGDAVRHARRLVGDVPFLCMLGDAVFSSSPSPAQQLVDAWRTLGTAIIGVEQVPVEKVSRYGIVGGEMIAQDTMKLTTLVEKPPPDQAPSRYAIAARYILTPCIFECIDRTTPGTGGEIQLTDAIRLLLEREPVHAVVLDAQRHDIGNPLDWLRTNLIFAARDAKLWRELQPLLNRLMHETHLDQ
jgi:UTP--glucose-1-phosphate uridylyltransferase